MHAPTEPRRVDQLRGAAREAVLRCDLDGAVDLLQEACAEVDSSEAHLELAEVAMVRRQYAVAASLIRRGLAARPGDGLAWARLGNALWRCQRYEESRFALDRAAFLLPGHWLVEQNRGLLCYFTGDAAGAVRHFEKAIGSSPPENHWLRSDLAHAVLKTGDLRRGLELFEARWEVIGKSPVWGCGLPQWDGSRWDGATILLHAEQGYGDTLQFFRFVPRIREAGGFGRVVLAGPLTLKRLLSNQCEVDEYVDHESVSEVVKASREASCHAPLVSAFSRLRMSYDDLPVARPYLSWPAGSPRGLRPPGTKLAVGVVWAASVGHERSRMRSLSPVELLPLAEVPGVRLWSLQMAPHAREAVDTGADLVISDATLATMDFADTAGIVQELDAVVTVDTSMVHLAGALGKRTFMLNPAASCWRWARGAAPWYASVELFDQSLDLTWTVAVHGIKKRLDEMIRERSR